MQRLCCSGVSRMQRAAAGCGTLRSWRRTMVTRPLAIPPQNSGTDSPVAPLPLGVEEIKAALAALATGGYHARGRRVSEGRPANRTIFGTNNTALLQASPRSSSPRPSTRRSRGRTGGGPRPARLTTKDLEKAAELGMDPEEWRAKLSALLMVLGKPAPRFLKALEPAVLLELLNSPHSVAAKVLELKLMCPYSDLPAHLQCWPAMLTSSLWGSVLLAHAGRHPSFAFGVCSVAITPDGRHLFSAGREGTLRQWDLASRRCVQTISLNVSALAVNPNPSEVWGGGPSGMLRAWDLASGSCDLLLDARPDASGVAVAFTPDGSQAVSVARRDLSTWDVATRVRLARLDWGMWGSTRHDVAVAFMPDGSHFVCSTGGVTAHVFDLQLGKRVAALRGHSKAVTAVAVTPDGSRVVTASCDKELRVWDCRTATCVGSLEGHTMTVNAVAVHPDGCHAVSASTDRTLKVWDIQALRCIATLRWHNRSVNCVAISPDGSLVVSGSDDGTVRIWEWEVCCGRVAMPAGGGAVT